MSNQRHEKIDYLELPAKDFEKTKHFFSSVFNWSFTDYGSEYMAFSKAGLEGGFYHAPKLCATTDTGSVLIVFYSQNLEQTLSKIKDANSKIIKPIFSFPGGRRFHFADPNGNEFAVWSDADIKPD